MRAVIYARYSSLAQNEQSIEEQVKKCETYATVKQYNIVNTYIDKAKSGSKNIEKRTSFLKMINDAQLNMFDIVLVYKLDRFSRDEFDTKQYEKILQDNNVKIESATESYDPNTVEGFILKSMLQLISQIMPKQLSPRVKDGMQMNANKFLSTGGTRVLGYKTIDKKLLVEEQEREIVETIFKMFADGYGYTEIADALNSRGFLNVHGKKFSKTSFYTILTNKKYIGTYTYKGVETPNVIPPIIEYDLFQKVQKRLESVKHLKNTFDYLLSGKIFYENEKMTGSSAKSGKYYYYVCDGARIKRDDVESQVLDAIKDFLKSDIEQIAIDMEEYSKTKSNYPEISRLESRNKEIDKLTDSLVKLSLKTNNIDSIANEINALNKEKTDNIERITFLQKTNFIITKEMTVNFLKDFILYDDGSKEFKRDLFMKLVNKVEIDNTGNCNIFLNLPNKNNSPYEKLCRFVMVHLHGLEPWTH